jgi:hypothetical protein
LPYAKKEGTPPIYVTDSVNNGGDLASEIERSRADGSISDLQYKWFKNNSQKATLEKLDMAIAVM